MTKVQRFPPLIFLTFCFFLVSCVLVLLPAIAQDQDKNFPAWLKRVEFATRVETDQKPTVYFQTVQPLYQDEAKVNTFFIQPRFNLRDERWIYNLGTGYRRLASENLILGVNVFGDYQDLHKHGRVGVGAEALGQIWEARINGYFAVTPKRLVEESANSKVYEKPANGLDYEIGAPLPYLPWLKAYGSGFWYDFDKFANKVGWKTRLEARVNDNTRLEFYTWDDNKGRQEFGGQLRYSVAFNTWKDICNTFKVADTPFPHKELAEELLVPVERNYDIVVERWITTKGLTVEAGRS